MTDKKSQLDELIGEFLEHLEIERGLSPLTVRNYDFWLRRFSGWLNKFSPRTKLTDIGPSLIRRFRVYLARLPGRNRRPMALTTQSYHVIALRSFLRWCAKVDLPAPSPEKIDVPKARSHSLVFLNPDQLQRLLSAPPADNLQGLRDRALLETLFSTGLRVSELASLNRDQIDLSRREFSVIGKGGRARVVFLSARAAAWLERYLRQRRDHFSPLFIRFAGKKPDPAARDESFRLTPRSIERLVEKYRKRAGISVHVTPHSLRHSFASDLLQGGANLREVQELLGHKNVSTTQIYTHVTNRQLKEVHLRAHSGNK
jgi:site-specific recombinase XerD